MPVADQTMHVGICRSADTDESTVTENVMKARRLMHNSMYAGLHGENGFDPETFLHPYNIWTYYLFFCIGQKLLYIDIDSLKTWTDFIRPVPI